VSRSSNVRISLGRTIESPFRCAPSSPPPRVRLPSVSSRPSFLCRRTRARLSTVALLASLTHCPRAPGKGGKNRRRGKNEGDEKRELVFKEDGQGETRFGRLRTRRCVSRPLLLRLPSLQSMPKCCACSARSPGRPGGGETLALSSYARRPGNGRLEAQCIDGTKRLCHIRGKMRKKVWVNTVSAPRLARRPAAAACLLSSVRRQRFLRFCDFRFRCLLLRSYSVCLLFGVAIRLLLLPSLSLVSAGRHCAGGPARLPGREG